MGQSNGFAGYGEDRVDALRTHPNLWQYKQNQTFEQAPVQRLDFQSGGNANRLFVAYTFYMIRDYLIPRNPGVDYCILPQSVGGSGFTNWWHAPNAALTPAVGATTLGVHYETTITQMNAFLAAEVGNTIDCVILQNGEQETGDTATNIGYYHASFGLTDKQAYTRYVTEMIADMTARVTGGRTWPFLIGQMPPDLVYPPGLIGPSADGGDHSGSQYIPFFEAQAEMPGYVSNCAYIDSLRPTKVVCHDGIKVDGGDITGPENPPGSGLFPPDGLPDVIMDSGNYWLHTCQAGHHIMAHRAFKQYMRLKGYGTPITLSYVAPAPGITPLAPSLDLAAGSDTGSSSTDNITTDTTPDIIVTFNTDVEENDIIRLRDGVTELVAHTITAGEIGSSTISLGLSPLSAGAHSLTARHERGALASPYSTVLTFTVDVTGPTITAPSTANVNEGSVWSVTLTADEAVTWTKTGGADAAAFTLAGATLSLPAKDYETQAHTWVVQVTATDVAGNTTDKTITVTIVDMAEDTTPPTITSPNSGSTPEGTPWNMTLTANETVTWAKVGGADAASFTLAGAALSLPAKDYETEAHTWVVQVQATDGFGNASTIQTITVTITDVAEGGGATRSFGAEGVGVVVTGSIEYGAEGFGIVES
jgi:hypothetical protein